MKMLNGYSPEAKATQSRVRKQNNCPSFGNKSTSSRIPTEQETFVSNKTVQNRRVPVSIKHGLRTADCGLQTANGGRPTADGGWRTVDCGLRMAENRNADYGLGIKHGVRHKTRTKHHGLGIKYGLG